MVSQGTIAAQEMTALHFTYQVGLDNIWSKPKAQLFGQSSPAPNWLDSSPCDFQVKLWLHYYMQIWGDVKIYNSSILRILKKPLYKVLPLLKETFLPEECGKSMTIFITNKNGLWCWSCIAYSGALNIISDMNAYTLNSLLVNTLFY